MICNCTQSRRASLAEATANALGGYLIAVGAQLVLLPLFGLHATTAQHFGLAACFLALSLARSYVFRRLFEARRLRQETQ